MKISIRLKDWAIDTAMKRAIIKKLDDIENNQINSRKGESGIRGRVTKSRLSLCRTPTTELTQTHPSSNDRTSKHSRLNPWRAGHRPDEPPAGRKKKRF